MNPPTEPPNLPPRAVTFPPLSPDAGPGLVLEALLKRPEQLVGALQEKGSAKLAGWLALSALLTLGAYGLLVGSFSGGGQLLAAPLKISLGGWLSILICLPSLFIFTCLAGAEVTLRGTIGVLCAVLALTSMLLIGFAPVAWIFSQSTESIAFIGSLHLLFWLIGVGFGLRLLRVFMHVLRARDGLHLRVWALLFIFVSLQMTTALRPIIGTAPKHLPTEKKFFLEHWLSEVRGQGSGDRDQ